MRVKSRRKAREAALKALYEVEIGKGFPLEVLRDTLDLADLEPELHDFAETLVTGVLAEQERIDNLLNGFLTGWDLERVATVDKNMLRLAYYELERYPQIPPAVTIDEAIEIARKYSTAESGKFVNGVLARALETLPKANWDPSDVNREPEQEEKEEEFVPEVIEETIKADSEEAGKLAKVGGWKLRPEEDVK